MFDSSSLVVYIASQSLGPIVFDQNEQDLVTNIPVRNACLILARLFLSMRNDKMTTLRDILHMYGRRLGGCGVLVGKRD